MIRDAATRVIHVVQGEHAISDDPDAILTTVLGSCVSACIMDADRGIGGLNHFLLPDAGPGGPDIRYAAAAMEVLVNGLMRRGASARSPELPLRRRHSGCRGRPAPHRAAENGLARRCPGPHP